MRKIIISTALLAIVTGAVAQELQEAGEVEIRRVEDPNRMSIRVAGYEVWLEGSDKDSDKSKYDEEGWLELNWPDIRHGYKGRLGLIEGGHNFFRTYGDSYAAYPDSEAGFMDLGIQSGSITINLTTLSTSLARGNRLGVTMGIGFTYNQYALDMPTKLVKADRMLHPLAPEGSLKWTRLRSWWVHMPLVLEVNPTRNFFISAGGYADFLFWSDAKWKSPKEKLRDPYMSPIQVGLTARIGFRQYYFYGNYALTEFFQKGKGPRLSQYSFGLGIGF